MTEPPDEFAARIDDAMAAIEDEMARVGADWDALDAGLLGALAGAPDGGEADDEDDGFQDVVGVDVLTLLEVLRALPDGAGTAAVLAALEPPPD
jgi:hypothetical protein